MSLTYAEQVLAINAERNARLQAAARAGLINNVRPAGRTRLMLGDSITEGAGSSGFNGAWVTQAGRFVGTEQLVGVRAGFPGENSAQLRSRLPGLLDSNPTTTAVHIACGTNDVGQTITPEQYVENIAWMRDHCATRGLPITLSNIPARNSGAAQTRRTHALNMALGRWAADNAVPVADVFAVTVDPATGNLAATYDSGDGIHPNDDGHTRIAETVTDVIAAQVKRVPWPVSSSTLGLLPNPLNLTDQWDALAGWASGQFSQEDPLAGDDLTAGRWMTITHDNTAGDRGFVPTYGQPLDMTGVNPGDKLMLAGKMKITGTVTGTFRLMRDYTSVTIPFDGATRTPRAGILTTYTVQPEDIGQPMRWAMSLSAPTGTSGSVSVGQMDAFNLTALDIPEIY